MRSIRSGKPHTVLEITTRTYRSQKRLPQTEEVKALVLGCLGRAQHIYPVKIYAFVVMSNHYHMLVSSDNAEQMAAFMGHLNGNISREINRTFREDGALWHRRFRAVPLAEDEETLLQRLRYILRHGVKERLVARCRDWPGASSLRWLTQQGVKLTGIWRNRTAEYQRTRLKDYVETPGEFDKAYNIELSPLPCWQDMEESEWRARIVKMVVEIEEEEAELRRQDDVNRGVLGVEKLRHQDRNKSPKHCKRSPAPSVHAANKSERSRLRRLLRELRAAYSDASQMFRSGQYDVKFPAGTFRPQGAFMGWSREALGAAT